MSPDDDLGTTESAATTKPPLSKKPRDPVPDPTPDPTGGTAGTAEFIDACLLPEMTKATFSPTGSIDANDEGVTAPLNLPFPFTLYGTAHTKYWITTNGQLGFGGTPGGSAFGQATCPLPGAQFTTPILLAYSADLVGRMDPDAGVCYAVTGTAPNRKLVVTWKNSFFYEAWLTSSVTFSAMLNEGASGMDVVINQVTAPNLPGYETGSGAALGKQAGTSGYAYSCFQSLAPAGTSVHYNP